jgi:hypothetical protein
MSHFSFNHLHTSDRIGWVNVVKQPRVSRPLLWLTLGLIVALSGCGKFNEGDCVQDVRMGYIWRITEVSFFNKYRVQAWMNGKWDAPVDGDTLNLNSGYVKVSCPFSTQIGP